MDSWRRKYSTFNIGVMTVLTFLMVCVLVNAGSFLSNAEGTDGKWSLKVTDLYDNTEMTVVSTVEDGVTKYTIDNGCAYHEYQLSLKLNGEGSDGDGSTIDVSGSRYQTGSNYQSGWEISQEDKSLARLKLRSNGLCTFEDSFADFSFTLNITSVDDDIYLNSAIWHDVELEYQGKNQYGISKILTTDDISVLEADNGVYVIPIDDVVDNVSQVVIWEYEKKTYTLQNGSTVEYYERVSKERAPKVTAYAGGNISVAGISKDKPVAVMVTNRQSIPTEEDNKYDCYWFYYYTGGYVKAHNDFTLDFYNYIKDKENNTITLESYNQGVSGYAKAAMALGSGSNLTDTIEDLRYGNSKIPDNLKASDFELEDWNIPATYTDPYDGTTYKVCLEANYEVYDSGTEKYAKGLPLYPISACNITVDSGVGFPNDCSYMFFESTTFSIGAACDGARAHGWLGFESISNEPHPDEYHKRTAGHTKSFRLIGDHMADNVTDMSNMFCMNSAIFGMTEFDISGINTTNVTDMSNMINVYIGDGGEIKGLSKINTKNAVNLKEMFRIRMNNVSQALDITAADLVGFETSKVENMEGMFADCDIRSLDISGFDFSSVTSLKELFFRDYLLEELKLPESMNTEKVTDMSEMFKGCQALVKIDNLTALDTGSVTTMAGMFGEYYFKYSNKYSPIEYAGPAVESIDLSKFSTDKVTDMSGMFCLPNVKTLDVSKFNTENVTSMAKMFKLDSTETLDISEFNTGKVTDMSGMFNLEKAEDLKLGNINTGNVTNVNNMFTLASVKEFTIDLDLSKASLTQLFDLASCTKLTVKIKGVSDNSRFDINAPKLVVLDLSGSDMNLIKALYYDSEYSNTFYNCKSLIDIYLPAQMPDTYNSSEAVKLPSKFYLVGRDEEDKTIEDLSGVIGNLSDYSIVKDGTVVTDTRSDRPILKLDNAILLRAADINPAKSAAIMVYKRDENGSTIYNEETQSYEYDDIEEIILYRYDGVDNNYSSSILDGYPNFMELVAVTDPLKPYPDPIITWSVEEVPDSDNASVIIGKNNGSDDVFCIGAYSGTGTATVKMTVEGYDKGDGTKTESITDTVKVTVLPMIRVDKIGFDKSNVTMKPGDSMDNPVKVWNSMHENEKVTFPGATYESENPDIVEVDANTGKLTAKSTGTSMITATSNDPRKLTAQCYVKVTETGESDDVKINWLYLTTDNELLAQYKEDAELVAIVGSSSALDEVSKKKTISYDKATDTIILDNYNELNLCVFKQGVKILLKGNNKISGYGTPLVDGFCIDADCIIKAEAGASLTVPKTAYEEHPKNETEKYVCTLDNSVSRLETADGNIVFSGPKNDGGTDKPVCTEHKWDAGKVTKEATATAEGERIYTCTVCGETKKEVIPKVADGGTTDGSGAEDKTPAVGTTEADTSGKATYKVEETGKDSSGNTVVAVAYVAPSAEEKKTTSVIVLDTVTLSDGTKAKVTSVSANAFKKNTKIKKVTIGSNVETVGANAFLGCTNLTTVTVKGNNLTKVNAGAFKDCKKLTKITLGKNVTSIGKNAFSGDKKLKTIVINSAKLKSVGKNAFKNINKKAIIKVPKKQIKAYKKLFKKAGLPKSVKIKKK